MDSLERVARPLLQMVALDAAVQLVGWAVSALLQTEMFFDLVGSCTFFTLACSSLALGGVFHQRQVTATTLVAVWAMRLGTFLFLRVLQAGKDSRFDGVRNSPPMLFVFWTVQGVWVLMVLLPVLLLNVSEDNAEWLQLTDVLGMGLWALGFLLETAADYQKFLFRLEDSNKNKWVSTGLWSVCRHPNYLGEMVLWWGIYLLCFAGLNTPLLKLLGLASPVFTIWLLTTVSGVPLLERAAKSKWGSDPEYQEYVKNTPCLLPWRLLLGKPKAADKARAHAQ